MPKTIVVVGSINFDLVASAPRIPRAGETVAGLGFQTFPGGKGANQAVAAARLGGDVSMIGKLGSDAFAGELRASLEQAGVKTEAVGGAPGPSGVALITTGPSGENSITVVAGANAQLSPADLELNFDLIRSAGMLLVQLETPFETVECLAAMAVREKIPLMLDPAPARTLPDSLLKCVSWLTPNETEIWPVLGREPQESSTANLQQAGNELLARGAQNVVLKLGGRGCYLGLADGTRKLIPAYSVRAVDTTAAGDAFNGALAVALLNGKSAEQSARWASAVAAISVTRHGAQPSMPTPPEVEQFLDGVEKARV